MNNEEYLAERRQRALAAMNAYHQVWGPDADPPSDSLGDELHNPSFSIDLLADLHCLLRQIEDPAFISYVVEEIEGFHEHELAMGLWPMEDEVLGLP